ncbi:MAG: hypothetical protein ABEH56_05680 [Salinirussus sp.]
MSGDGEDQYAFVCPECEEELNVNESMKQTLVEKGCVICGSSLSEEAFTDVSSIDGAT